MAYEFDIVHLFNLFEFIFASLKHLRFSQLFDYVA